jgi:hypothetical protein
MSIVAYYIRLSPAQLPAALAAPERLASGEVSVFGDAQLIDVDRAWDPIAWLVSDCKRAEQAHNARVMESMRQERKLKSAGLLDRAKSLFRRREDSGELVAAARALEKLEADAALIGIEGRGPTKEAGIDFGMGPACVFSSKEVSEIAFALRAIDESALRKAADFEEMDRVGVFPDQWLEEGDQILNEYILPNFRKLQNFYGQAASGGQIVLMWYT